MKSYANYFTQIKNQLYTSLQKRGYSTSKLSFDHISPNIIKVCNKKHFLFYIDLSLFKISDIVKNRSDPWKIHRKKLVNDIISKYNNIENTTKTVCIMSITTNYLTTTKCITSLKKQNKRNHIILMTSSKADINYAISQNVEYIYTKKHLTDLIKVGINYVKKIYSSKKYIIISNSNIIFSRDWINTCYKKIQNNDFIYQKYIFTIDTNQNSFTTEEVASPTNTPDNPIMFKASFLTNIDFATLQKQRSKTTTCNTISILIPNDVVITNKEYFDTILSTVPPKYHAHIKNIFSFHNLTSKPQPPPQQQQPPKQRRQRPHHQRQRQPPPKYLPSTTTIIDLTRTSRATLQTNSNSNTTLTLTAVKYSFENNKLYSLKINNFKSNSTNISIHLISNSTYVLTESTLSQSLSTNLNYIDTSIYKNIKYLLIKNSTNSPYTFSSISLTKVNLVTAKSEAHNISILPIPEIKIYKTRLTKQYNVACILDLFSYECFSYDLKLHPLKHNDWENTFRKNKIDFFLCESAWSGNNGSWDRQITSYNQSRRSELNNLLNYLDKNKIPKIFYNKEDPFNFKLFKNFAAKFNKHNDCIITTDENMITQYKKLGCNNVIAFPFCCQPVIHNPINKQESTNKNIIFPCSYYVHKYKERCTTMKQMINLHQQNIHIYDRQYIFNKQTKQIAQFNKYANWYNFPLQYDNLIKGSLNYKQVLYLYKQYKCVMNVNTVTDSNTMFARRVIEAAASNIPIISNKSLGVTKIFGNLITNYRQLKTVNKLLNNPTFRHTTGDKLYKKVMKNYTYNHLITTALKTIPKFKNTCHLNTTTNKIICLIYSDNKTNLSKFQHFTSNPNYTCKIITKDTNTNTNTHTYTHTVIMNDKCLYNKDYINNMMLPFLYTDATIIGKACYNYQNKTTISPTQEHTFTNRLNPNTLVIKHTPETTHLLTSPNPINNIKAYLLKSYNKTNMYSTDKYDFVDNDTTYHYFNKYPITLNKVHTTPSPTHQPTPTPTPTPIIMCCYDRVDSITKTIQCLNKQTDKNFELYIWDNSHQKATLLKNIKSSNPSFNISCHHSKTNVGGIGRFYIAKVLENTDYVIFIDDDQTFDEHLVAIFKKAAKKNHSFNWYGRKFIKGAPYFATNTTTTTNTKCTELYDYGGTGGMIIDINIFKDINFYKDFPKEYLFVEDLWMSFYATTKHNYKFYRIKQNITNQPDNKNQCTAIWDIKNQLLEYCRKLGWNV